AFYHQYSLAIETGKAVHFEVYSKRIGKWLQVKAFPSKEGLSVYFDDITEKVKAKQELERLALVASKTINGVIIMDAEGKIEWVNDAFNRVTGYTLSEVVGKFPSTVLAGEDTDEATLSRIKEKTKKDKPFTEEVLIYRKSGEMAWLSLDITPILDDASVVVNIVVLQTDITFRKEAEARQQQLTEDLYKKNSDLQQFTYIVSHNLRSPITAAMGLINLLSIHDRSSADFDTTLGYLQESIYKIDSVLKDLHKILSARDKKNNTEERVEIEPLCQQVIDEQWELLKRSGSEVFMDIEKGIVAQGNKAYLYSIFHNLLSNAVKYRSPDRPLQVSIACFTNEDEGVTISFSDNGSGFDMQLAGEDLFKLYKRFHNNIEGSGIGLYLIKKHVESMDGQITVESKVNVGTKFLIYLNKPQK
ncbi:MAG: PAS domain S-box protein, partial [Bacteroidetes bacterium]|nr:PAS domain S-box protein [Bacteroidota bacterium]